MYRHRGSKVKFRSGISKTHPYIPEGYVTKIEDIYIAPNRRVSYQVKVKGKLQWYGAPRFERA